MGEPCHARGEAELTPRIADEELARENDMECVREAEPPASMTWSASAKRSRLRQWASHVTLEAKRS